MARYMRNQIDLRISPQVARRAPRPNIPSLRFLVVPIRGSPPEFIFDQDPGELFVCRVAGNYMNVDILASLEYGVEVLGAPLIMVLGHTNCGAVKAVLQYEKDRKALPGHLQMLLDAVSPGVTEAIRQGPTDH